MVAAARSRPSAVAGFVLLEAIVGLALIAMVAAAAMLAFGMAADRSARAGDRLRAVLAADAILARVGLDLPLRPQRTGGTLGDGAAWTLEIRPFTGDEADGGGDDARPGSTAAPRGLPLERLFVVDVRVTPAGWRAAPVELATLRLREPPP
jgi:type II secretory pathway pseudopilin PulG